MFMNIIKYPTQVSIWGNPWLCMACDKKTNHKYICMSYG